MDINLVRQVIAEDRNILNEKKQQLRDKMARRDRLQEQYQSESLACERLQEELSVIQSRVETLSQAVGDVAGPAMMPAAEPGQNTAISEPPRLDIEVMDYSDRESRVRDHTVKIRKAVAKILLDGREMSTQSIVEALEKDGIIVSDGNKVANLSAILSRASFFNSQNRKWTLDVEKLRMAQPEGASNVFG